MNQYLKDFEKEEYAITRRICMMFQEAGERMRNVPPKVARTMVEQEAERIKRDMCSLIDNCINQYFKGGNTYGDSTGEGRTDAQDLGGTVV